MTKADLKNGTGIDASDFCDLASLKSEVYKLDI